MLFDWHISIYDWAIWDSPAEAPQYLQKKKSVCYQTNIYLNIRYFYLGSILQLSFLYSVLIVNSWMCYLPDKYHHCWFNTLIQVYQIVIVFCSLFINFKYWWIAHPRNAHWRAILRWAVLSMSFIRISHPNYFDSLLGFGLQLVPNVVFTQIWNGELSTLIKQKIGRYWKMVRWWWL